PANARGWLALGIGGWQYRVPPDHKWATTGATTNGIDITSTDTAHFGAGFATNYVTSYSVDQVVALVFQYGLEDAGVAQYQATATEGPFPGASRNPGGDRVVDRHPTGRHGGHG